MSKFLIKAPVKIECMSEMEHTDQPIKARIYMYFKILLTKLSSVFLILEIMPKLVNAAIFFFGLFSKWENSLSFSLTFNHF